MIQNLGLLQWTEGTTGVDLIAGARRLEDMGYHELWLPEVFGREPLSACGYLLASTTTMHVSSGIANIYARDPDNAAQAANSLAELSGNRFRLGLGVSHPILLEARGHEWTKPVPKMRRFLERYYQAPIESPLATQPAPVIVAGHGPGLLGVAKQHGDGAFLFLQPLAAIRMAREILGPHKEIHTVVRCVLDKNADSARDLARRACAFYINLPAYHARWTEMGFNESDWVDGGSERLIDAVCVWGDAARIRDKLLPYYEAGATHVVLYPCNPDETYSPTSAVSKQWHWQLLEALAAAA